MKRKQVTSFIGIGVLILITCAGLAYSTRPKTDPPPPVATAKSGDIRLSAQLSQSKVAMNGDGTVSLELTVSADSIAPPEGSDARGADMVIVLDRSGSMSGQKIEDARRAVLQLLSNLTERDRFSLVSYSDGVTSHFPLSLITDSSRRRFRAEVRSVMPGGATNLGAGLETGIRILTAAESIGNTGRVILISDGLANRGVVDPAALGTMASAAPQGEFAVSTVGVGLDFNESVMTAIADRGTGRYYFMENPGAFAEVFQKEFQDARIVVGSGVEVRIPLPEGVRLTSASGYPVTIKDGYGRFYPGDILSGQTRKFFLTLTLPTNREQAFDMGKIIVAFQKKNEPFSVKLDEPLIIACVADADEALSSIDKKVWEKKVILEDYNRLKEDVAGFIRKGEKGEALRRIETYQQTQRTANAPIKSEAVTENIEKDADALKQQVEEVFAAPAPEMERVQKKAAKDMQYEGYSGRRMNK